MALLKGFIVYNYAKQILAVFPKMGNGQSVMNSDMKSNWRLVTSGVL